MKKLLFIHVVAVSYALAAMLPAGWTCNGNCGISSADDGVVTVPAGAGQVLWVSTANGISGVGSIPEVAGDATNGSVLTSPTFTALAGDTLRFLFNYVTSDGAGYADYAWARLLPSGGDPFLLFTARTTPAGSTVPGFDMPPIGDGVTVNPFPVGIIGGGPEWSPLGGSTGSCYANGCGYTGWIEAVFTFPSSGAYVLQVGATNWVDRYYDSGLALTGVFIGDTRIDNPIPEPVTVLSLTAGLLILAGRRLVTR